MKSVMLVEVFRGPDSQMKVEYWPKGDATTDEEVAGEVMLAVAVSAACSLARTNGLPEVLEHVKEQCEAAMDIG